jgi:hypothetical protein
MITMVDFETEMAATRQMLVEKLGLPSLPPGLLMRDATPPPDDDTRAFCEGAGFPRIAYIDVAPAPTARPGRSHENVGDQVRLHGGSAVVGWLVRAAPALFYEAGPHTVWKRPDGALVEVTPQMNETQILFALDGRKVVTPFDPRHWPKKRVKIYDAGYAAGVPAKSGSSPKDRLEGALDEFMALADRHDAFDAAMAEDGRVELAEYAHIANELVHAKVNIFLMVEASMMVARAKKKEVDGGEEPSGPTP